MEAFLNELAEILEVDKVGPGDVLADFEDWDSLCVLSTISTIDSMFRVNVSAAEIKQTQTAQALFDLVQAKLARQGAAVAV